MKLLNRLQKRIVRDISQLPFFQIPAERAYQAALENYLSNLPKLSPNDLALVKGLRQEGVVMTSLEALEIPSTPSLLQVSHELMPKLQPNSSNNKNEYVIHATSHQIKNKPEIFLWGLEERLLNIIENYLGLPPAYHGSHFRRDLANEVQVKSRKWHIDREDRRVVKVIIYLNNVGENNGPFQYIPRSLTSIAVRSLRYKYGYIQDEPIELVVPSSQWKACTGTAGSVIFADTGSIFHRGKKPIESDRFAIFFDYTYRQPQHPYYCKSSLSLQDLVLLARPLSERQKECLFWYREGLKHPL